ncbi:ash family protein [Erwinia tracheiphila]|uniref:Ash family protein n=1 Tax=Erwinia tracheiphila TaxID=65700 RepID=A0A0M2K685_9GAMM|nr:hypothetical protein SY86_01675 [Erwinia tracheiphila]
MMTGFSRMLPRSSAHKKTLHILITGGYIPRAAAKSAAGCSNPVISTAHNRANAVFLCAKHGHISIMVGRAGPASAGPGSVLTGIATPVRLTTLET